MANSDVATLACVYASLILADDKVEITDEKINKLLAAAKVNVPGFWAGIFARVLSGKNVEELITAVTSPQAGSAAPAAAAPAGGAAPAAAKKEEKKEEEEEVNFQGGGLFGGGDDEEW